MAANWMNCEEMWIQFHRRKLNNFNTHTNNHIEAFNRKIKRFIKPSFHLSKTIEMLQNTVLDFSNTQQRYIIENAKSVTNPIVRNNSILSKLNKSLSFKGN